MNSDLPYISPGSNNAYGSVAANVPKPPRVADTRTSLAAAMKEKEDAMNARLRAEEEQRAKEAVERAERAGSLAPPSPTVPQQHSREQTVASAGAPSGRSLSTMPMPPPFSLTGSAESRDVSQLTGLFSEADRTYVSEFVVDPVIGTKVSDDNGGLDHGDDNDGLDHGDDNIAEPEPEPFDTGFDPVPPPSPPPADSSSTFKSPGPTRRSMRTRRGGDVPPITGGRAGKTGGASAGDGPTRPSNGPVKENAGGGGGSGTSKKNGGAAGGGRPPPKGPIALSAAARRRKPRKHDTGPEAPLREGAFDWLMRIWFERLARWQIPVFFLVIAWIFSCVIVVQYLQAIASGESLFRGPGDNTIYFPPMEQPRDIKELAERVHLFERNLNKVDYRLDQRIGNEMSELKAALSSFASASATASSTSVMGAKDTASALAAMKEQLESLQKTTAQYKAELAQELEKARQDLKRNGQNLEGLLSPKEIREEIIKGVREALPSTLAVSLDDNGGIHTTEKFRTAIEDLFDNFFPRRFNEERKRAGLDTIKAVPSWDEFIKDNAQNLKTAVDKLNNDDKGKAVLGKDTVMTLVQNQLDSYQKDWEKKILSPLLDQRLNKFKTTFQEEQNKRIASLENSLGEQQQHKLHSFKDSFEREQKQNLKNLQDTVERDQKQALGSLKDSLVKDQKKHLDSFESALEKTMKANFDKQHAEVVKKAEAVAKRIAASNGGKPGAGSAEPAGVQIPDYASGLTGAMVWPYLTSPSYVHGASKSALASVWGYFAGITTQNAPHPAIAITPTADAGDCWAFPGRTGTLAIRLSEPIYPSHITIEHISKALAHDYTIAPKTVEFWVRIRDPEKRQEVESAAVRQAFIAGMEEDTGSRIMQTGNRQPEVSLRAADRYAREFVKIHTVEYNMDSQNVQSFELPVDMTSLRIPVDVVAFFIKDNHGNQNLTCLYRMKVHGYPPSILHGDGA